MKTSPTTATLAAKPHYLILDGLRGVAALMVLVYHVFEAFATSPTTQWCNHGYLAVPFFFILSGFVIGYAYDDRWGRMSTWQFFKRRLIRLHPMVLVGTVLGVLAFFLQGGVQWDGTKVSISMVMLAMLFTLFMIPAAPGTGVEIRGNGEVFPINGPFWSLFIEYVGNIAYAWVLRKLSTRVLAVVVVVSGLALGTFALTNGSGFYHLGVGWTMNDHYLSAGLLSMLFCFSIGLFMARIFSPTRIRAAFWWCSLGLVAVLAVPYVGGPEPNWANGLYDALCVLFVLPALVWLGASGSTTDSTTQAVCTLSGKLSYPVYVIHYPSMYLFYSWVWDKELSLAQTWPVGIALLLGNILLAYLLLRFYDEPVRKWLRKKDQSHT